MLIKRQLNVYYFIRPILMKIISTITGHFWWQMLVCILTNDIKNKFPLSSQIEFLPLSCDNILCFWEIHHITEASKYNESNLRTLLLSNSRFFFYYWGAAVESNVGQIPQKHTTSYFHKQIPNTCVPCLTDGNTKQRSQRCVLGMQFSGGGYGRGYRVVTATRVEPWGVYRGPPHTGTFLIPEYEAVTRVTLSGTYPQ